MTGLRGVHLLAMKRTAAVLSMMFIVGRTQAQEVETYVLNQVVSNRETIVYTRVIRFDDQKHLFHVQDYEEAVLIRDPRSGIQGTRVPVHHARSTMSRASQMVDR